MVGMLAERPGFEMPIFPKSPFVRYLHRKPLLELFWITGLSPLYKWVYGTADRDSFVSVEKAERILGWAPRYSNVESLIRSYKYYLEHSHEIETSGVTHRVAWKQGILALCKRFL